MPEVIGVSRVIMQPLHQMWTMQRKPPASFTDFLGQYGALGFPQVDANGMTGTQTNHMEMNPVAGCVHARRMFVPHNNSIVSGQDPYAQSCPRQGIPSVNWSVTYTRDREWYGEVICTEIRPPGFCECGAILHCQGDLLPDAPADVIASDSLHARAILSSPCQGFTALFLPIFPQMTDTTEDNHLDVYCSLRWRLYGASFDENYYRWYSLSFRPGGDVRLGYNNYVGVDGEPIANTWVWMDSPAVGSNLGMLFAGQPGLDYWSFEAWPPDEGATYPPRFARSYESDNQIEVLLMGGNMLVTIGSGHTPWVVPLIGTDPDGNHYWGVDAFAIVSWGCFHHFWSVHPTKFYTDATMVSNEQNLGFVPDPAQRESYVIHCAPDFGTGRTFGTTGWIPSGSTVSAQREYLNGTNLVYRLNIHNEATGTWNYNDYADYTAAVRGVSAFMPGITYRSGGGAVAVAPEVITVSHSFNLSDLSITSQAQITVNNFTGVWTNDQQSGFLDNHGHVGITIDLGVMGGGVFRQFTGIGNTRYDEDWGAGGQNHIRITCRDGWLPLNTPRWNLPWMDGWNVLYALGWLAEHGGVAADRIAWRSAIPQDPYDENADGSPSYFLPLGPAGTPLTRHTGGQMLSAVMKKIANTIGCLLFFDVWGVLRLQKFSIPSGSWATKTFTHVANSQLSEIFAGASFSSDLSEVRNAVTCIGVNAMGPLWNPIVAHYTDEGSVWNDSSPNFLGYYNPLVWADNIFSDIDFASEAAYELLSFLRLPAKTVQFTSWFPPDQPIYPLDLVRIVNPKSGAGSSWYNNRGFLVLATQMTLKKGAPPSITIAGRWMPN